MRSGQIREENQGGTAADLVREIVAAIVDQLEQSRTDLDQVSLAEMKALLANALRQTRRAAEPRARGNESVHKPALSRC